MAPIKAQKYPAAQRVPNDTTASGCMCCHRGNKEEREWKRQEKDDAYQAQLDVLKRRKSGAWQKVLPHILQTEVRPYRFSTWGSSKRSYIALLHLMSSQIISSRAMPGACPMHHAGCR